LEGRITASLAEAQYAPLKIAVKKVEANAPRTRIETEEDVPVGPSEEEESSYLASEVSPEESSWSSTESVDENLPKMEDLNQRLPKKVLDQIEELFRAKFTKVQRISEDSLK